MKLKRVKYLTILSLFFIIVYTFSIKNTIKLNNQNNKVKADIEIFEQKIVEYSSYNKNYLLDYYKVYQQNNNLIESLNTINYPDFFDLSTSTKTNTNNNLILVNPKFYLDEDYVPNNLIPIEKVPKIERINETMLINKECLEAYTSLYNKAKYMNIELIIYSAYRTYEKQEYIYNNRVDKSLTARPGHSEHQTGLTLDIATIESGLTNHFEYTKSFNFLQDNAHLYGFILRYPKDKNYITGYAYEPWHYRYVGLTHAKAIKENNLTLEEYIYSNIPL